MDRRTCLHWAGAAVAALAGCSNAAPGTVAKTPTAAAAIEFREHRYDPSRPGVVGTIENTGPRTVSIVNITATFYDGEGDRLAEWTTNVGTVEPGMVVAFTAPYPDDETVHLVEDYQLMIDEDKTRYA